MRVQNHKFIESWEKDQSKIKNLTERGIVPVGHSLKELRKKGEQLPADLESGIRPIMLGQVSGAIDEIKPAKAIIDEMVYGCLEHFKRGDRIRSNL
jgi:hypothetical protein